MSGHREAAVVSRAEYGPEDHGILTFSLYMISVSGSCGQGFGGIVLRDEEGDRSGPALVRELCEFFGVEKFEDIKGRSCFILRCYEFEDIEGLEVDGKRWTLTGFRKRHYPKHKNAISVLEVKRRRYHERLSHLAREVEDTNRRIMNIADGYRDWEE
jgi:hypothetical protein